MLEVVGLVPSFSSVSLLGCDTSGCRRNGPCGFGPQAGFREVAGLDAEVASIRPDPSPIALGGTGHSKLPAGLAKATSETP